MALSQAELHGHAVVVALLVAWEREHYGEGSPVGW